MVRKRRPRWRKLESSNLDKVRYDRINRVMHVIFNNGQYYTYADVSYYRYLKLLHADSKGRYFYYKIRTSYHYRRVG